MRSARDSDSHSESRDATSAARGEAWQSGDANGGTFAGALLTTAVLALYVFILPALAAGL